MFAGGFRFGAVLGANVLSALVCVLILVPVNAFDTPGVKLALRPYQLPLGIVLGVGCDRRDSSRQAFVVPRRGRLTDLSTTTGGVDGMFAELRARKSV